MPDGILPFRVSEKGLLLLNQQCWHWGHDIRRAQKGEHPNALLEYGFTRCRPPEGQTAATMYSLTLPSGYLVALWGFGIWFGDVHQQGIYLNRFRFEPQWLAGATVRAGIWTSEQLACARPSGSACEIRQTYALMAAVAAWIGDYEHWALTALGAEYRRQCVESYIGAGTPAEQLSGAWRSLAQASREEEAERFGSVSVLLPPCPPPVVTSGHYLADRYKQRDRLQRWLEGATRKNG